MCEITHRYIDSFICYKEYPALILVRICPLMIHPHQWRLVFKENDDELNQ